MAESETTSAESPKARTGGFLGDKSSQTPQSDLPLIVWLAGDEPFADDFCIDADATMAELGIKRSRLTQISGKELRVGRIRVDRYIRPVYRAIDIAAYKNWTRATATKQRNSDVLAEAAQKISEQSGHIAKEIELQLASRFSKLEEKLSLCLEFLEAEPSPASPVSNESAFLNLTEEIRLQGELAKSLASEQRDHIKALNDDVDEKMNKRDLLSDTEFKLLKKQLDTLDATIKNFEQKLEASEKRSNDSFNQQANTQRDLGKALTLIVQFQRDLGRQMASHRGRSILLAEPPRKVSRSFKARKIR